MFETSIQIRLVEINDYSEVHVLTARGRLRNGVDYSLWGPRSLKTKDRYMFRTARLVSETVR